MCIRDRISPRDGINPEDIKINELLDRITKENIEEVIIAVKPSIEGETTAMYISKLLENQNVKVSRLAHGIPLGVDMEYIDSLTLEMALEDLSLIPIFDTIFNFFYFFFYLF